jgi:uncharacterized protein (DUF2126 family)
MHQVVGSFGGREKPHLAKYGMAAYARCNALHSHDSQEITAGRRLKPARTASQLHRSSHTVSGKVFDHHLCWAKKSIQLGCVYRTRCYVHDLGL